ncbi:MAG: hypothetical protein KGL94_03875, partial [Acidobacteriota bacterium]|nr:hypothetical protein [Acidobacteriota bacterium]
MRHVVPWLAGWLAFFWLWLLLAGDWNRIAWIGAASCATVAATLGELARTRAAIDLRLPWRALAASWTALPRVLPDFAIVMLALLRRTHGRTHTRKTDVRGSRAVTNYAANLSPNAYVIAIDD